MMDPRTRRLQADYDAVRMSFLGHPAVAVEPIGAIPPESYRVTFSVPGLRREENTPVAANSHTCLIRLPHGYPRDQPSVTAETPVFHPNVANHYCIADYWSADQTLVDVITKIGHMIQYQIYSVDSPLDPVAAHYARSHPSLFPLGNVELSVPEVEIAFGGRSGGPV